MVRVRLLQFSLARRSEGVRAHVQSEEGEVDRGVDLLGGLALAHLEALEVNDEEVWGAGDGDLLGGFALALAVRAFPHLVFREALLLRVGAEAVVDVPALLSGGAWDLDGDAVEGFVSRRRVFAGRAAQAGGMLSGKEVRDGGVFAVRVPLPFDLTHMSHRHVFALHFFFDGEGPKRRAFPV